MNNSIIYGATSEINMNSFANSGVGGWDLAGILTYGSGTPEQISATTGVPTLNPWAARTRACRSRGTRAALSCNPHDPSDNYINPDAYSNPAPYTLGDTLIETERRGCGIANENLSLAENFDLPGEGHSK
jgi:hypothetical protein